MVPRALELLRENPLAESTYYQGDLLTVILAVPTEYWSQHPDLLAETTRCAIRAQEMTNELD